MKFDSATVSATTLSLASTRAAKEPTAEDPTRRLCLCTAGAMFGMALVGWLASPWLGQTSNLNGFALVGGVYALLALTTRRQRGGALNGHARSTTPGSPLEFEGQRQGSMSMDEAIPPHASSPLQRAILDKGIIARRRSQVTCL
jgi:hypothetical protein